MMIRRSACLWLVAVVVLAGCAAADEVGSSEPTEADETAAPATPVPTPTATETGSAEGDTGDDGLGGAASDLSFPVTGELGLVEVEGGCPYVEVDGQRYELVAGPGSDLAIDTGNAVVANAAGEVIAEAGDTITVEGSIDEGMLTFCQIGPVLVASSITAG